MKKAKFVGILLAFSYLPTGCSYISKDSFANTLNTKQKATVIENLPDGNYRYCSDPNPYSEEKLDVHRYCFTFTKMKTKVVGGYLYKAPKNTPYMCIEGTIKDNLVAGIGYENIGPSSEPYTEKDFLHLNKLPQNEPLTYWDDVEHFQGGLNLKVGNPNLYKLSSNSEDRYASHWGVVRYNIVQLDLTDFEAIKSAQVADFKECYEENV